MNNYLIEFRFQGKAKNKIRQLIYQIDKKFSLGITGYKRSIPHITLCGSISTDNESKLIKDFIRICSETPMPYFEINGYGFFDANNVVFVDIIPSDKLDNFRWNLSKNLQPYCQLSPYDYNENFNFHATLAKDLADQKFVQIKKFVLSLKKSKFMHIVIRVTLLKNGKILKEYDFLLRKSLNQKQALDSKIYKRTMKFLKNYFNGTYDPDKKIKGISFIDRIIQTLKKFCSRLKKIRL